MGRNSDTEAELVTVRLADVKDVESELLAVLDHIDAVVRLRPRITRLLRIVREMDPDMTPTRYVPIESSKAYRMSSERPVVRRMDSSPTGPRWGVKKKDP